MKLGSVKPYLASGEVGGAFGIGIPLVRDGVGGLCDVRNFISFDVSPFLGMRMFSCAEYGRTLFCRDLFHLMSPSVMLLKER